MHVPSLQTQIHLTATPDLPSDPSIRISSPKERNLAPALPGSNRAREEKAGAVPELRESAGFPQGFLCLVLSCPVHVCPELGSQGWKLRGQTSEISGYFWNFIEEWRDGEPRAGCTKGKGASSRETRTGKRHKSPRADGSRGGELLCGGERKQKVQIQVRC